MAHGNPEPWKIASATSRGKRPCRLHNIRCLLILLLVIVSCGIFKLCFDVLQFSINIHLAVPVAYLPSFTFGHSFSKTALRSPIRNGVFSQDSEPSEDYIIDLKDVGPRDKIGDFMIRLGSLNCFKQGINISALNNMSNKTLNSLKECPCGKDYYGPQCSIPGCVYEVPKNKHLPFQLLSEARRVVMAFPVNHEFGMTEIRVRMLANVVDVFIIGESNITAGGDPKPLHFFEALKSGFLDEFQHKILYVYRDHFPAGAVADGWKADRYIRTHMSEHGMPRIIGLSPEDIFLLDDADEIPKEEAVLFLKTHKGYQQPIRINMRHSYYGYFYVRWKGRESMKEVQSGSTIQFLSDECSGDAYLIRKESHRRWKFEIGVIDNYGGHHCSWCHSAEGLRQKLLAHQLADNSNAHYRKHPHILDVEYLESLRRTGMWFDGTRHVVRTAKIQDIAPQYVLEHSERYRKYLVHPDDLRQQET